MEIVEPLVITWAFILALAVFIYVVLDGFDLGIGILFWLFPEKRDRDVMMNSVAPVWDGNETWLVMGGGGLMAAFPLAYAILMPALYMPIILMLLALIFRGVAFEYRWRTERWRKWWDRAFIGGSATAALCQGIALGALLQGIDVDGRGYGGGWWDWLTPFSLLTGISVVAGYTLLGATYLVMKTTGDLQAKARNLSWVFGAATIGFIVAVSLATPFLKAAYYERWLTSPGIIFAAPIPLAVAALTVLMFRSLRVHHHEYRPFIYTLIIFFLCFVGLGVSMFPYVVPTDVTIYDAAAPFKSQMFMLIGAIVLLPMILAYTAYAYWVFRGKVDPEEGYH